jgi:phosphatidylglycerophosphatase A
LWQDADVPASAEASSPSPTQRPPLWSTLISTALGAGFSPIAPGTCGTLMAVPLAWALARAGGIAFVVGTIVVSALGVWAAEVFCKASGVDDDQRIVVDEVAGYLVTLLLVPRGPVNLVLAVIVFRLFDIWKPGPVRLVDEKIHGGLGVMLDDIVAGLIGMLVMLGLHLGGVDAWLTARILG